MSMPVNNQYYVDQYQTRDYGVAPAAAPYSYETEGETDADAPAEDGDRYIAPLGEEDANTSDGLMAVEELASHLDEITAAVSGAPQLRVLQADVTRLRKQLNQARNPQLSETRRQALLIEIDAGMTELDASLANEEPVHDLKDRIEELKGRIEEFSFPAEQDSQKQDLQRRLDQAQAEIDLKAGEEDLDSAREAIDGVESDFEEIKAELDTQRDEDLSKFDESKDALAGKIQNSTYLRDEEKKALQADLETKATELRQSLEDGSLSLEDAVGALDAIDYDAGGKARRGELVEDLSNLSAKVPSNGYAWKVTKELASEVTRALHSGNWDRVSRLLDKLSDDGDGDGYETAQGNNVVMQFMGTIFYKLAAGDDEKFNAYLDLIDVGVRRKMETAVMANRGEQYDADGYNNDVEKEAGGIYGIPADCKEALETSIRWSRDTERARTRITGDEAPAAE